MIKVSDYDVILLNEACPNNLRNQFLDSNISLQGYHTVSNLSSNYHCRGTLALVKTFTFSPQLTTCTGFPYAETVFLNISFSFTGNKSHPPLGIVCVYRSPPPLQPEETIGKLAKLVSKITDTQQGDLLRADNFNLPNLT